MGLLIPPPNLVASMGLPMLQQLDTWGTPRDFGESISSSEGPQNRHPIGLGAGGHRPPLILKLGKVPMSPMEEGGRQWESRVGTPLHPIQQSEARKSPDQCKLVRSGEGRF